jgi:uncharacterized protein (DUF849 family)
VARARAIIELLGVRVLTAAETRERLGFAPQTGSSLKLG